MLELRQSAFVNSKIILPKRLTLDFLLTILANHVPNWRDGS